MDFNVFNVKLTEHLWQLDVENHTGFFSFELDYDTGMHHSAKEGNVEDIAFYLNHLSYEKNPESRIEGLENGCTPMHVASKHGHLNVVRLIKNSIDDLNPADAKGDSVLHYAAANGHLPVVQEIMKDLQEKNPASLNEESLTPMHLAAINGHLSIVQEIKNITGISNPSNLKGWTVLHSAAFHGQLEIVEDLCGSLEEKNPIGYSTMANMTPVHEASKAGHLETMKFFYKILSDISGTDAKGMNALHHAAEKGHIQLVKFLTDTIAIDIKDINGKTAKDLASNSRHESVVNYLQHLDRLPSETREQAGIRRLEKIETLETYEMMISKMKNETEKELPTAFMNNMQFISESSLPSNFKPCNDYNKGTIHK